MTLGTVPATAGTARVEYMCGSVGPVISPRMFDVTITPPATAHQGQTATISATVVQTVYPATRPVPAGEYEAVFHVALEGAGVEKVRMDLTNPAIPAGELLRFSGSAQLTFPNTGTVSYRPDRFGYSMLGCIPRYPETVPVVATTRVS
ncbi:hypothetical protein [Actinophytocola gossypii]|uniref:Uncharacterized protein n=1 Tax=Actinophytocola gossypii TaxID=2812003 RepID=A0ABT2JJK0_9PSEU|nr:hypothetical protein [Actinophytocola gossypii]MCT2588059.1 hypothetical protein [Actinophytocola gossypii]